MNGEGADVAPAARGLGDKEATRGWTQQEERQPRGHRLLVFATPCVEQSCNAHHIIGLPTALGALQFLAFNGFHLLLEIMHIKVIPPLDNECSINMKNSHDR